MSEIKLVGSLGVVAVTSVEVLVWSWRSADLREVLWLLAGWCWQRSHVIVEQVWVCLLRLLVCLLLGNALVNYWLDLYFWSVLMKVVRGDWSFWSHWQRFKLVLRVSSWGGLLLYGDIRCLRVTWWWGLSRCGEWLFLILFGWSLQFMVLMNWFWACSALCFCFWSWFLGCLSLLVALLDKLWIL